MSNVLIMFYIFFSKQKPIKSELRPAAGQRYVAVPEQHAARSCYFQVYENGYPLYRNAICYTPVRRVSALQCVKMCLDWHLGWYHVERLSTCKVDWQHPRVSESV